MERKSVTIDGIEISFIIKETANAAEAVLFIHGLACSCESFISVFDFNYFKDKTLLLIDLPGYGDSFKPDNFSYTMEDQAEILIKVLAKLPKLNLHIVAHSMGGAIGLLMNRKKQLPQMLSFVNIEGNLIGDDCGALSRGVTLLPYNEYEKKMFNAQKIAFRNDKQLRFNKTTPLAVYKSSSSLVKWSDSGELLNIFNSLDCRKCYFYGEENKDIPVIKELGFVKKYMVANSGHAMMTENPAEFYKLLNNFIEHYEK